MSIESRIQAAATQNAAILQVLSETDYAPPSLLQHQRYIADLENEHKNLEKQIKTLESNRVKEFKEHKSYSDSVMKRFAYKVSRKTDKFEAKASKEEREYFDALRDEHLAKANQKDLGDQLQEANKTLPQLQIATNRHNQAQRDLDALYDSIFEGPTPGFPEEDDRERAAASALDLYSSARTRAESETQAVQILADTQKKLKLARIALNNARDYSRMDMFGGGAAIDMMERNELGNAELLFSQCQTNVARAQRMSPAVQGLPDVNIAHGSIMGDVLFDNIFTDMAFHDKIKNSIVEFDRAARALDEQEAAARQRSAASAQELAMIGRDLENAREDLQKAREYAFERVAGGKY